LIAQHCANAVGVPVGITANLIIHPHNHLSIIVRKKPEEASVEPMPEGFEKLFGR